MKNNMISGLALLTALLALAMALFALNRLDAMRADYQYMRMLLEGDSDGPQEDLTIFNNPGYKRVKLESWTLTPEVWEQDLGANVTLRAIPQTYEETMEAVFRVTVDGAVLAEIPCQWDGTAYTATASIPAANGYAFYLLLTGDDRTGVVSLSGGDDPNAVYCVNLERSLCGYAEAWVGDWTAENQVLTLTEGFAQVQLPLLTANGQPLTVNQARLVIRKNDREAGVRPIALEPEEADGMYAADLAGAAFPLPELEDREEFTLWLEAELSDGTRVEQYAVGWILQGGSLIMVSG